MEPARRTAAVRWVTVRDPTGVRYSCTDVFRHFILLSGSRLGLAFTVDFTSRGQTSRQGHDSGFGLLNVSPSLCVHRALLHFGHFLHFA